MNLIKLCTLLGVVLLSACAHLDGLFTDRVQEKVSFDLSRLDTDGLYGPADGKRSLSYEFCIPARVSAAQEVMSIDPTAIVYKESPGRLQCGNDQYLVIGDTYQDNYLATLRNLVKLEYVTRIVETWFE